RGRELSPAEAGVEPAAMDEKELFGQTRVWNIHLEIPAKEFDALQPAPGGFGFPGGPQQPAPRKDDKKRDSEKNLFGTDFPWVNGRFTADGKTLNQVGVRYAGDITYFVSARGLKRPLKIDFTRSGERFQGLTAVQLHAMPLDLSKAREAIAYALF